MGQTTAQEDKDIIKFTRLAMVKFGNGKVQKTIPSMLSYFY